MKTVYIMIGCPGSGKTTWVKEHELPSVSRDKVRAQLGYCLLGEKILGTMEQEDKVTEECSRLRAEYACSGVDFAIDDINLRKGRRAALVTELRGIGYHVVGVWMRTKLEECLKRRSNDMSEDIIARMWISAQDVDPSEFDELIEV